MTDIQMFIKAYPTFQTKVYMMESHFETGFHLIAPSQCWEMIKNPDKFFIHKNSACKEEVNPIYILFDHSQSPYRNKELVPLMW